LLGYQVLDEASAGDDRGAKPARSVRIHVRASTPTVVRGHQSQADLVLEHVGRRIDEKVHRPPQRDSHRSALWFFSDRRCHALRSVLPG
jgi:hypothetical protein